MRIAISLLSIVAFSCLAFTQGNTPSRNWRINEHHALIWNSEPYLPIGVRIGSNSQEIDQAKAQGILDVIVELPASGLGWADAIQKLEQSRMRYMVAIDSLAPAAEGYAVEPQSYRVTGITSKRNLDLPMPGVTSVLAVLALKRDSSVTMSKRVPIVDGRFTLEVNPSSDLEHVLLIYPETLSVSTIDLWEGLDRHRDALLRGLRIAKLGPGLRGVLNPLGNMVPQTGERLFVPKSRRYRLEMAAYLEQRYRNVESAQRAWSMSVSDLTKFDELARLVPLWAGTRGVQMLWDPVTDKLYPVEARRSVVWSDIRIIVSSAETRRFRNLVSALQTATQVPVVQEWVGWLPAYEQPSPALDGVGARTSGAMFSQISEGASRAASSVMRWDKPGWLVGSNLEMVGQEGVGQVAGVIEDLQSIGIRAMYFRTNDPATRQIIAQEAARRATAFGPAQWSPLPIFFPENSTNPANIQRLPAGRLWLPSPLPGNRIDLGSQFFAYRHGSGPTATIAVWTNGAPQRVRLNVIDPSKLQFSTVDGSDPNPKMNKKALEVTIGNLPLLISGTDEIPIPQPCMDEAAIRFQAYAELASSMRADAFEEGIQFRDAWNSFERSPGGSFVRMSEVLAKLNSKVSRTMWIEAEAFRDTTFSDVANISGTSGGQALFLRTTIQGAAPDFFATYSFMPRSGEELEVWIAARIPKEFRRDVNLQIGSQLLKIDSEPVSLYGPGFGWYKMGTTRLGGATSTVQLRVLADVGTDIAIDAIVFHPGTFSPRGVKQPDAVAVNLDQKPPKLP